MAHKLSGLTVAVLATDGVEQVELVEPVKALRREGAEVHVVSDKGLVYGMALYDDYPPYIQAWLRHRTRGLVVMPVSELNRDFRHPNVLPYDGTNLAEVERAMRVVLARKPGEELRL